MTYVSPHKRCAHKVKGHFRDTKNGRVWVNEHIREGSDVAGHYRSV